MCKIHLAQPRSCMSITLLLPCARQRKHSSHLNRNIHTCMPKCYVVVSHLSCFSCHFSWLFEVPARSYSPNNPVSSLACPPSLGVSESPPVDSVPLLLFLLQIFCLTTTYLGRYSLLIIKNKICKLPNKTTQSSMLSYLVEKTDCWYFSNFLKKARWRHTSGSRMASFDTSPPPTGQTGYCKLHELLRHQIKSVLSELLHSSSGNNSN